MAGEYIYPNYILVFCYFSPESPQFLELATTQLRRAAEMPAFEGANTRANRIHIKEKSEYDV